MLSLLGCQGGTTVTGLGGKVKTKTQAFFLSDKSLKNKLKVVIHDVHVLIQKRYETLTCSSFHMSTRLALANILGPFQWSTFAEIHSRYPPWFIDALFGVTGIST